MVYSFSFLSFFLVFLLSFVIYLFIYLLLSWQIWWVTWLMCWVKVKWESYCDTFVILIVLLSWKDLFISQSITELLKWKHFPLGTPLLTSGVIWVWSEKSGGRESLEYLWHMVFHTQAKLILYLNGDQRNLWSVGRTCKEHQDLNTSKS